MEPFRILVLEKKPALSDAARASFSEPEYSVRRVTTRRDALRILRSQMIDLIILNVRLGDHARNEFARNAAARNPDLVIAVVAASGATHLPDPRATPGQIVLPSGADAATLTQTIKSAVDRRRVRRCSEAVRYALNELPANETAKRTTAPHSAVDDYRLSHHVLNTLPYPFYVIDVDTHEIVMANTAGHPYGPCVEQHCFEVAAKIGRPCDMAHCPLKAVKTSKQPVVVEHVHRDSAGRLKCFEIHAFPVFDEAGKVTRMIEFSLDVTDRKLAENELKRRVEEEVAIRLKQEQAMIERAKLAALGEMVAGMAHEINQPLNTIAFSVNNMLLAVNENSADVAYVEKKAGKILASVERMKQVVDHVRQFSREQTETVQELFDVNQSIANAVSMVAEEFAGHGIDLSLQLAPRELMTLGNTFRFEQVIVNLVSNARDAVLRRIEQAPSASKTIRVATDVDSDRLVVQVRDSGIGIPEPDLDKVMRPFYTTKKTGAGTGLGLSIAHGIITRMGGWIGIESSPSSGTIVTISLPLREGGNV